MAQAADAAAAAKAALKQWKRTPMEERCALVGKIADVYEKRMGALVPLVQAETGSTINVAESMQVPISVERFRYYSRPYIVDEPQVPYAMNATALGPAGLQNAMMFRQPVGVVACITPYNFPLTNVAGKIAPALAMGNTVVIKPAPQDPLALLELGEILDEVGLPPGRRQHHHRQGPEAGSALVDSRDVDMISFTGSSVVGCAHLRAGRQDHEAPPDGAGRQRRARDDPRLQRATSGRRDRVGVGVPRGSDLYGADTGHLPSQHLPTNRRSPWR